MFSDFSFDSCCFIFAESVKDAAVTSVKVIVLCPRLKTGFLNTWPGVGGFLNTGVG